MRINAALHQSQEVLLALLQSGPHDFAGALDCDRLLRNRLMQKETSQTCEHKRGSQSLSFCLMKLFLPVGAACAEAYSPPKGKAARDDRIRVLLRPHIAHVHESRWCGACHRRDNPLRSTLGSSWHCWPERLWEITLLGLSPSSSRHEGAVIFGVRGTADIVQASLFRIRSISVDDGAGQRRAGLELQGVNRPEREERADSSSLRRGSTNSNRATLPSFQSGCASASVSRARSHPTSASVDG